MVCVCGRGRKELKARVICLFVGIYFKGLTNHNMLGRGREDEVPNVASTCTQFEKFVSVFSFRAC